MKNVDYYLKLPYRLEIVPDIYKGGNMIQEPEFNEETIAALKEAEEICKNPYKYKGYTSIEELIEDILKDND